MIGFREFGMGPGVGFSHCKTDVFGRPGTARSVYPLRVLGIFG